ncbi:hypothetical protein EV2_030813 [Malus domestica]
MRQPNAPCLHELKLQHGTKCSLPARAETATRHQMLFVRTSLKLHEPKLLVCTSIKGNTKAPGLHEPKRRQHQHSLPA